MEKKVIFGNWIITMLSNEACIEDGAPYWIGINYQNESPKSKDDICPDWGVGDIGNTAEEAAISCINFVWRNQNDGGLNKAVELSSALVALGFIRPTCQIDNDAAIIDGVWYFGSADIDSCKKGIERWDELCNRHELSDLSKFGFSSEGIELAEKLADEAWQRDKEWYNEYIEWESTWIDGPQMN